MNNIQYLFNMSSQHILKVVYLSM